MAPPLPWLLLLGLFLPVALAAPLILEYKRGRDGGPRFVPTSTLKLKRRERRTANGQKTQDPKVRPGLTHVSVDLEIIAGTEMEGNVVTRGRLTVGRGASFKGSAKAMKGVRLLREAKAYGNLISGGKVVLGRLSYVQGVVYAKGKVTLKPGAVVKGIYTEGRVDVYPGAEVLEDVIAREGVHLVVPVEDSEALEDLESLNALLSPERFLEEDE